MAYTVDLHYTPADQDAGFPALIARMQQVDTERLVETYLSGMKDCFGMFGHNACTLQNQIGAELLRRGVTEAPNLFRAIPIVTTWKKAPTRGY